MISSLTPQQLQTENEETVSAVEKAISSIFPIKYGNKELKLISINHGDLSGKSDKEALDLADTVRRQDKSWTVPIHGTVALYDSGKQVGQKRVLLANVPVQTAKGMYVVQGTEYSVPTQLRLKAGVYVEKKTTGEYEISFNLEHGRNFRIMVDPAHPVFRCIIGQKSIPLYSLLIGLGISQQQMQHLWGKEIYNLNAQNAKMSPRDAVDYFYQASLGYKAVKGLSQTEEKNEILKYMSGTLMDKDVNKITIGQPSDKISPAVILQSTGALLQKARKGSKGDNKAELQFKKAFSAPDLLADRVMKSSRLIKAKIRNKLSSMDDISKILPSGTFTKPVKGFFLFSSLAQSSDAINPVAVSGLKDKVTLTGEGGLESDRSIRLDDRALSPTHLGFIDPVHTPESEKLGVNVRMASGASKKGHNLQSVFVDAKTGKAVKLTPIQTRQAVVAFPGQYRFIQGKPPVAKDPTRVRVIDNLKAKAVPASKVQYIVPDSHLIFGSVANALPFLSANQGNRAMMASKQMEQAIGLKDPDEPLVQTEGLSGNSVEAEQASQLNIFAPVSGTVIGISRNKIIIKPDKGVRPAIVNLPQDVAMSTSQYLSYRPVVSKGQHVKKGQLVAEHNYSKNGKLALGKNMTVAYVPYKGMNYEDAVVVSHSAAKKLTSSHLYEETLLRSPNLELSKTKLKYLKGDRITAQNLGMLDNRGIIKPGSHVKPGDILVAAVKETTEAAKAFGALKRQIKLNYKDASLVWKGPNDGVVKDVVVTPSKVLVRVYSEEPLVVGDKLAGRHGNKGTVSAILPDEEMPKTQSGKPIDVLLNPAGIPSRLNPSQLLETGLGKYAEKTGKRVVVPQFPDKDYTKEVLNTLKKAGIPEKEHIIDPKYGKLDHPVTVGKQYIMKMEQQAHTKLNVRQDRKYDADEQPLRGKKEGGGARAIDPMTFYSLLSHGSKNFLRETTAMKSERNDDLWDSLQNGKPMPAPKTSFVFNKFLNYMKGMGADVRQNADSFQVLPMTDKQIKGMSSGEVKNGRMLNAKNMKPDEGGLYDPKIFGAVDGENWGHINLAEPMLNPIYAKELPALLGIKLTELESIAAGKTKVNKEGKIDPKGTLVGGEAIEAMLKHLNLDAVKEKATKTLKTSTQVATLNKAARILQTIKGLQKNGIKPTELVLKHVPVLPPKLRPVYPADDGSVRVSGLSSLYRDLILSNDSLKDAKKLKLPESDINEARNTTNKALSALMGTADPLNVPKGEAAPQGILRVIGNPPGKQPKSGFFQSKVMKRRPEFSGTAVIEPDPKLTVDQVGLPEDAAWGLYKPFIIGDLRKMGMTILAATKAFNDRNEYARKFLSMEIKKRPMLINRAPSLHKFSIMALHPKLTNGKVLTLHPMIVSGFNADFDGDTMGVHIPVTEEAVKDAQKMTPSQNLFRPANRKFMLPFSMEYAMGLYLMTRADPKGTPKKTYTISQLRTLFRRHKISMDTTVKVGNRISTVGRFVVNSYLPEKYRDYKTAFTKKYINDLLSRLGHDKPELVPNVVDNLKDVGRYGAYFGGASASLKDVQDLKPVQEEAKKGLKIIDRSPASPDKKEDALLAMGNLVDKKLVTMSKNKKTDNGFLLMMGSGAKGSPGQIRQMTVSPIMVQDHEGKNVPVPLQSSYAEGMKPFDYFMSLYGARRGMIGRKTLAAEPGAFAKELLATTVATPISTKDDPDDPGIKMSTEDPELPNRFLAQDVVIGKKTIAKAGEGITPTLALALKKAHVKNVYVKSPLSATTPEGVPATSFGLDENGKLPDIGTNVGVKATQAITEPLSQSTMNMFHTGGVASKSDYNKSLGLKGVESLLRMTKSRHIEAVLAANQGTVQSIRTAPTGGHNITIGSHVYYIPPRVPILVKQGEKVYKGTPLCAGVINPKEVYRLRRSIPQVQKMMVHQLKDEFLKSMGIKADSASIETIVRAYTNTGVVTDPGGHKDYSVGDYAPVSTLDALNRKSAKTIPVNKSLIGMRLATDYGTVHRGTLVDEDILEELRDQNIKKVKAYKDTIQYRPVLSGSQRHPLNNNDWMSKVNFRFIGKELPRSILKGEKSYIHSTNPVTSYAYGKEFGKAQKKYHY